MELAKLMVAAQAASPQARIGLRDPIAAFGARAIDAVAPWLTDPLLGAFAVRVIQRAGQGGEEARAVAALRGARRRVPGPVADDIIWALAHLATASPAEDAVAVPLPTTARLGRRGPAARPRSQ